MAETALIFGASGFIGSYLYRALSKTRFHVTGTYHSRPAPGLTQLDLLDTQALRRLLQQEQPGLVLFLAGTKDVKRCEQEPQYAIDINVQVVQNYLEACHETGQTRATLFFSTDYVFPGTHGHYQSADAVGPRTVYGVTNLLSERLLLASKLPGMILRVSAVMGREGGFFQWLEQSLSEDKPLSLFANTYFSPTSIGRLCDFVTEYSNRSTRELSAGMHLKHISDGYRFSRHEFGCAVAKRLGKPTSLLQATEADLSATTFQADLSLLPDGLEKFRDPSDWDELEKMG